MKTAIQNCLLCFVLFFAAQMGLSAQNCCPAVSDVVSIPSFPEPERVAGGDSVTFMGFTVINLWGNFKRVWDGKTERTKWQFDLTKDDRYKDFLACVENTESLSSATLTLTLWPGGCRKDPTNLDCGNDLHTDNITLGTLDKVSFREFRSVRGQIVGTITINLLERYTTEQILSQILLYDGKLPMSYADDASVQYARIDLIP